MPLFDLVVMADWSAASRPGPKKPKEDQCWLAWGDGSQRPDPEYLRTRAEAVARVRGLLLRYPGSALAGFDFPYGFPHGSRLGGGREAASRLASKIIDGPDNANNRFAVAAALNAKLNGGRPGPFWGCPKKQMRATLTATRPRVDEHRFPPYRIVEGRLRAQGKAVQSVWKLAYKASVGSQTLLGLAAIHRLLTEPALARRSSVWPFETEWDARLDAIIHAEIWPSLRDSSRQPFAIKDARQVAEMRDWALDADAGGELRQYFARPGGLSDQDERICRETEGWILGVA